MVEERARHRLAVKARALLGEAEGDTLMAMLPPVGWADVATKQDLAHLERSLSDRMTAEIGELRGEIGRAMSRQTLTLVSWNGVTLLALAGLAFGDRLLG